MAGASGIVRVGPSEHPFRPLAIMAGILAVAALTVAYNQQPTEGQKYARAEIEKDIAHDTAEIASMVKNEPHEYGGQFSTDYRVQIISYDANRLSIYGEKYVGKEKLHQTADLIQTMLDNEEPKDGNRTVLWDAKRKLEPTTPTF